MKLKTLLLVALLATPAEANLQEAHQQQQTIQNQRDERRSELCENHLRQAQYKAPKKLWESWETYYRVSRGDLYRIYWYGYENNGPLRPKPCAVSLLPLNRDFHPEVAGRPVRGQARFVVEGNQLVRYSNSAGLSWNPENPNPRVEREVVGVKR
jgi:hypothetical protein